MSRLVKKIQFQVFLCLLVLAVPITAAAERKPAVQPEGLSFAGIGALKEAAGDLTGTTVKFAVICRSLTYVNGQPQNDYAPNTAHNCFKNRRFSFNDDGLMPAETSFHSTAICAILFGEDKNAFSADLGPFWYKGVVPEAEAEIYEFWHFLTEVMLGGSDIKADIITASIGYPFEDWWTRGFDAIAQHQGTIVIAGIGNGSEAGDPLLFPGASANVIGVGVVDSVNNDDLAGGLRHFALACSEHSSLGPTAENRCKPDIVAPGNCLAADAEDRAAYEPTGNWSSFSTPVVAGAVGLLVQKAKEDPNLNSAILPQGGNCVMKAILMNSATKLPFWHKGRLSKEDDHIASLDYIQGAGMLNASAAYKNLIAGHANPNEPATSGWDNNILAEQTDEKIYRIEIAEPAEKLITATVVWNKHFGSTYPFAHQPEKDGNLALELWVIDVNDPNNARLLDYSDSSFDNVEHIHCPAEPDFTNYEIVVRYSSRQTSQNYPIQRFAIAYDVREKEAGDNILWYDLNADGLVDQIDMAILFDNFITSRKSTEKYLLGDINTDGVIGFDDMELLLKRENKKADWLKN